MTLAPRNIIDADEVKKFLLMTATKLDWGDLRNEVVMDIGCGVGLNSTIFLVELFPDISKVIAIDQASDLVKAAKLQNMSDKIEFYTADIGNLFTVSPWEWQMSKIVSVDCFNWLQDPKIGFCNIYCLLNHGGTAAVLTSINSPYQECLQYLLKNSNWQYTDLGSDSMFPMFPKKMMKFQDYKTMLQEIGFQIVHWEEYHRVFEFQSIEDFIQKVSDFISPLLIHIPINQRREFRDDFFKAFALLNGISYSRKPCLRYETIAVLLLKP